MIYIIYFSSSMHVSLCDSSNALQYGNKMIATPTSCFACMYVLKQANECEYIFRGKKEQAAPCCFRSIANI